ncbi:cytochrome P450 [Paractinoplanes hotanensis]|uniref:Cytochrome P450 n=1 Tax=Paractinoplanes hotanensis TaxID=2906497 RepID=A0ABT0Y4X3_9ACTN|nr:cytochrome P450 [Actinoplanes hotanensis]MCM4081057.1 cytochrome P450 [Actinoplanes hotanensis]
MSELRTFLTFVAGIRRRKLTFARDGYLRGDLNARLHLAVGREDPYALYDRVRAAGPLVRTRSGDWVTADHQVCDTVLRHRAFGVRPSKLTVDDALADQFEVSFLGMDPPDHTRLRRLVQPFLGPAQVTGYAPLIERATDRLLDEAGPGNTIDLMAAVAGPLPMAVMMEMFGVPADRRDAFSRSAAVVGSAIDGIHSLTHAARLRDASLELERLFTDLFALRSREPADDLISHLVVQPPGRIEPAELLPLVNLLLVAGFETTVNLIGNAVLALMVHPGCWDALCADPRGEADAVIDETLRYDPPVQRAGRLALEDVEVAGRHVGAGEYIFLLLGGANRDPVAFPNPARFDPGRPRTTAHLAFASGIHYCVGQPLARLEATTVLRRLAERLPGMNLARPVRRRTSGMVRGPRELWIRRHT